jgi:outer membrane receptor for ferric coprogen and ferric-rhodotorulic acid
MNSVRDALKNTTDISSSLADTKRATFYLHGFEITCIQYDDIPNIFAPSNCSLDTITYDRVEVAYGSTELLNGWRNPSASINLVRKHLLRDLSMPVSLGASH